MALNNILGTRSVTTNIADSTTNNNDIQIDNIDIEVPERIEKSSAGMSSSSAFFSVADILCEKRMAHLKGETAGISYPNGYYWINIRNGPKLLYLITDESINSGGWLLAMRGVQNSETFNLRNDKKYLYYLKSTVLLQQNSRYLLGLNIKENVNYNPTAGLLQYNNDLSQSFITSSIGSKILTAPNQRAISTYDAKFETFNAYILREIMIIFHERIDRKITTYVKIPGKDLDEFPTLVTGLKKPSESMKSINTFKTTHNFDLDYNFKMNIHNLTPTTTATTTTNSALSQSSQSSRVSEPVEIISCLLGVHGTFPATGNIPRLRYIYAVGVENHTNRLNTPTSAAVLIEIPDIITPQNPIKYYPLGFEIYVK